VQGPSAGTAYLADSSFEAAVIGVVATEWTIITSNALTQETFNEVRTNAVIARGGSTLVNVELAICPSKPGMAYTFVRSELINATPTVCGARLGNTLISLFPAGLPFPSRLAKTEEGFLS
jgi:hypothetical protein